MKFCKDCGHGNQEDSAFCSNCGKTLGETGGAAVETTGVTTAQVTAVPEKTPEPQAPPETAAQPGIQHAGPPPPPPAPAHGTPPPGYYHRPDEPMAVAALVISIAAFFFCPLVGAVIALIFGYLALRNIQESGGALGGEAMAKAGIIISYVHLGLVALFSIFILLIVLISVAGH